MILCIGPTDKLQIVSGAAQPLDCHVSAIDTDGASPPTITTYRKNTAVTTATTADITDLAASGTTRNVKTINVANKGTVSVAVTVQHTDGTVTVTLWTGTLVPNQTLMYVEGIGWQVTGAVSLSLGTYFDYVATNEGKTNVTTYGDLTTVGPQLSSLPDGNYLIFLGCVCNTGADGSPEYMSISINGAAASDADSVRTRSLREISIGRVMSKTLSGGSNSIVTKYRNGDAAAAAWLQRYLGALRYA